MAALDLPSKMDFDMGSTEQKMDMTLDDIIKQNRKSKKQRLPNKARFKNTNVSSVKAATAPVLRGGNAPVARAALQRSVAARSSKMRQSKFAEARARNGAGNFPATQAAGKRAFATAVTPRNRYWVKSSDARRNNFGRQRPGFGQKLNPFSASAGNMKISVVNNGSKAGAQRFSAAPSRRRNGPNVLLRQVHTGQHNSDRMDVDNVQHQPQPQKQKAKTLDALFAQVRRNTQPQVVQPFTSVDRGNRRGGRNGYQGRRRQVIGQ